ncbi:hypothetical protein Tco_0657725 [Tanacetum coccineum]
MPRPFGTHDDEAGSSRPKRTYQYETVEEAMLPRVYHEFLLWDTSNRAAKNIEAMLEIKVYEVGGQEEFDEVVMDHELLTKKLIKFRLGGRGHTLTLVEFARRLGLYHSAKINKARFEVYFRGGLRSDENFNARDYWLSINSEEELHLSRSLASTIRSLILRVLQKMITYALCQRTTGYDTMQRNKLWLMSMFEARHQNGYANVAWLMARWLKRKGFESQRDSMICCGQLITKISKKMSLLTDEVMNSLSAPTYCRALDATTLRELIRSNGRLIVEDPAPGVPRVAMTKGPRPSMKDLYDQMGNMEICQGVLERMTRRQSYQYDRYAGVFEYMAGQHGIPLQGAYAPPGYDEE